MSKYVDEAPVSWHQKFYISQVPKDGSSYNDSFLLSLNEPLRHWGQIYTFNSPIAVTVQAERAEERVVVLLSLCADAQVPCSRCLEPAGVAINGELRYLLSLHAREDVEAQRNKEKAEEDGEEEVVLLNSWEDEVDLGPLAWEVLITALPPAALCSDSCKGLCPQCGANMNTAPCACKHETCDPRFDVLKKMIEEDGTH